MLTSLLPHIPAGIPHWWYYTAMGAAVFITGATKSGFGGGAGVLAMPLVAVILGPREMLGIMLPLLVACDVLSNLHHLGHYDWKQLRWLLPGAVGGVVVGTIVLLALGDKPPEQFNKIMNLVVGGICLAVVLLQCYRLTGREVPTLPPHPLSTAGVGLVAGALSTVNHAAGPIVTIYLLQEKLTKRVLVGTLLLYFLLINTAKLPTYAWLDIGGQGPLINRQTLHDSIWFIPIIPISTVAGAWMHHKVPEKPFAAFMYVAAGGTAAYMIFKALV